MIEETLVLRQHADDLGTPAPDADRTGASPILDESGGEYQRNRDRSPRAAIAS